MEDRKQVRENAERRWLLEDIIDRGIQTFLEAGKAPNEIKDHKLRPGDAGFEDYCEGRWTWWSRYENNVVRAARTAQILGRPFPANEAIAREMAELVEDDPEQGQAAGQRSSRTVRTEQRRRRALSFATILPGVARRKARGAAEAN